MTESAVTVMNKLQHKRSQICIHHSTISEIAIQQRSLNRIVRVKSQPDIKVRINYWLLFRKHVETF